MDKIVRKSIAGIKPYVPGRPIEEVKRELGLDRVIKLASNENCLGPSPKAVSALERAATSVHRYPDGASFHLKKRLSEKHSVPEGRFIIGNGSDEIIVLAARTFLDENTEAVIAQPTFLIYEIASKIEGAKISFVPLTKSLNHDLKAMKEAITSRTRIVFIANPDNPTGTYIPKKRLDEFFSGIPEDVIVFLDEAYFEFAHDAYKDYPDGTGYLDRPNVIVARSFSKAYGLAGLRVGYGIADERVVGFMERVRDPFNVNMLAQEAAAAALDDKEFLKKTLGHVAKEKDFLYKKVRALGLDYVPSATNFILINVKRNSTDTFKELLKRGVIVRDMAVWGFLTYIRVTIGTRSENELFLQAIKEVL